jgi:photosystem II stability/assembly factor-like uncharacterized protein
MKLKLLSKLFYFVGFSTCILLVNDLQAQTIKKESKTKSTSINKEKESEEEEEGEDMAYDIKHKSMAWFQNMKPGSDYFAVKSKFDKYFGNHRWEKSKPRQLGEGWLKSRIFYLDAKGKVQDEPILPTRNKISPPAQLVAGATQTTVGSWSMLGPVNSARAGYSSDYNHGGYVVLNRIDPTNPQKMFVSFQTGGLWLSVDGGVTWALTDANLPDLGYNDLDVCVGNPQIVYAVSSQNVIKSVDGGASWSALVLPAANFPTNREGLDIAVSPTDPNMVLVRWGNNVVKSSNGGSTWTTVVSGLPPYSAWEGLTSEMLDWSTNAATPGVVYYLTTTGNNIITLFRSANNGDTFTAIKTITLDASATGNSIGWGKLFFPRANPANLYVAVGSGANTYGHKAVHLYKLDATAGTEILSRINMVSGASGAELHHGDISMDPYDENKIVYGTYGEQRVHYSTNNGVSFTTSTNYTHHDIRSVDFVNGNVMIGSDGEVALSANGGVTYATITNSISNHELWGFGSAFKTDIVASGNNHGPIMIKEPGNGFDWYNGPGADQGNTDVNPLDDRYLYSQGYSNYRFFRTGVHQLINESNLLDLGGIYSYFNSIEFHPNKYYTIITHHAGQYPENNSNLAIWKNSLIKTEDNGASLAIVKTFGGQIFREKISMKNPNTMYVVEGLSNNKLWKTTDGGATWANITPTTGVTSGQVNISDIAVGDENGNEIWATYSGVQNICKILKSTDGGNTWTNLTQPILTTSPVTKIVFQRGSNGGVYIGNKSGIYYRNNAMANWALLGNGLPQTEIRFMFINYNQGKLKIGTSRGAFEHNLYEVSPPNALISASTSKVNCPFTEKVQFKDYSVVRNASATWAWSFPGGTPSTSTLENPIVSYKGATDGTYNVTLTVTDAYGTSTQTLNNFIQVASNCGNVAQDTVAGKALKLTSVGDYVVQQSPLNINTNTFTTSAWVKPIGLQTDFAGLMFMRASSGGTGLSILANNTLRYTWRDGGYNFVVNRPLPDNEWSHVALVVEPTGATVYVNGVGLKNTVAITAANFDSPIKFGRDDNSASRTFKGEMDEITFYNRALNQNEIREQMYLTKNNPSGSPILDASLLNYYQFNETEALSLTYDKTGGNAGSFAGSAVLVPSTAPIGGGVSFRKTSIVAGTNDFGNTGINLNFGAGTLPNAEVLAVRLNVNPNALANAPYALPSGGGYWIIKDFGTSTFTSTAKLTLSKVVGTTNAMVANPGDMTLFKRATNADATWGTVLGNATAVTNNNGIGSLAFANTNLSSFGQFSVSTTNPAVLPITLVSFNAQPSLCGVALSWLATDAKGFNRFEVERSRNGKDYSKVKAMSYSGAQEYKLIDNDLTEGNYYYRLKMVDNNGDFTVSENKVAKVSCGKQESVVLYPNPIRDVLNISYPSTSDANVSINIYNAIGKLALSKNITTVEGQQNFAIDVSALPAGAYFINLQQNKVRTYFKVIKQ